MPSTILVVTEQFDVTADHVVTELSERGTPVVRFDTSEFPRRIVATSRLDQASSGSIRTSAHVADLGDVSAVYYRRPSIYRPHPDLSEVDAAWAVREARFGFGGLLASLPVWLNHPADVARAEYKPVQFAAARAAGLTIPPTLLTNDAAQARAFAGPRQRSRHRLPDQFQHPTDPHGVDAPSARRTPRPQCPRSRHRNRVQRRAGRPPARLRARHHGRHRSARGRHRPPPARTSGYTPTVATTDAAHGFPDCAPYDRIVSTCSWPRIPYPWIEQTRPGGLILSHLYTELDAGVMALLRVADDGTATGHFLPEYGAFMTRRDYTPPDTLALLQQALRSDDQPERTPATVPSGEVMSLHFPLYAALRVTGIALHWFQPEGAPAMRTYLLGHDGSWAYQDLEDGELVAVQAGTRRLWDEIETAYREWSDLGKPERQRFGLTVTDTTHTLWLDTPNGPRHWTISD